MNSSFVFFFNLMTKTIAKSLLAQGKTGNEILEILDVLVAEYRAQNGDVVAPADDAEVQDPLSEDVENLLQDVEDSDAELEDSDVSSEDALVIDGITYGQGFTDF